MEPENVDQVGTQPASRPSRMSKAAERSCVVCHRRKVRCDKKMPCSTCTRTGVLCCYPPVDHQVLRHPRSSIADITSRLAQLERTVMALSGSSSAKESIERLPREPGRDATGTTAEGERRPPDDEMLVPSGDSTHYISDVLLSRVLEEEQEIRSLFDAPPERVQSPSTPIFNILSLAYHSRSNHDSQLVVDDPYPSAWQATQLWQVFLQNVDPIIKMLHIPTTQVALFTVASAPTESSPELRCLLFSICFAATTSLTPEEVRNAVAKDKVAALNQYKLGLERSLAEANFYETPTLLTLESVTLFLRTVRAHNTGRSLWFLWGLVVRAAMSIGLHRDGASFGLSPFDTERRRRLWWHMWTQDARAAEDNAIVVLPADIRTETCLPLNVNDSQLEPTMLELPAAREGWTEMTLPLVMMETTKATQVLSRLLAESAGAPSEAQRKEIVGRHLERAEAMLRDCNPVIPQQRAALSIARLRLRKLDFSSRIQWQSVGSRLTRDARPHATEENLVDACCIFELGHTLHSDDLLQNYRWSADLYPQFHALLYILWHLVVKPAGGSVERAWQVVNSAFDEEATKQQRQGPNESAHVFGSKWAVLDKLRKKAMRQCEQPAAGGWADEDMTPGHAPSATAIQSHFEDNAFGDGAMSGDAFPDFDALAGDFQLSPTYDFSGF